MTIIEWNDYLSVGIGIFDDQHKRLIEIINKLYEAIKSGKNPETQEEIFDDLILYTITHFTEEEKYFAQFNYPDAPAHKAEHDAFCRVIKDYTRNYYKGIHLKYTELLEYLVDWLLHHIAGSDKKYREFFESKGLK